MPIAYRTVKELKERTPAVLRAARRGDVIITLRGRPCAILRRFSAEELESVVLRESKPFRARLRRAIEDVRAGRVVPLDDLVEELADAGS